MRRAWVAAAVFTAGLAAGAPGRAQPVALDGHPDVRLFFQAAHQDDDVADAALERIAAGWRDGYAGIVRDLLRLMRPPRQPPPGPPRVGADPTDPDGGRRLEWTRPEHPSTRVWRRLMRFLEERTGQRFRGDVRRAQQWIWEQPYDPHPDYGFFKGQWYAQLDPRFADFFPRRVFSLIRLDEIDWGGVAVNGIPPLEHPAHLPAGEAGWLDDDHVVFGIAAGGETRAYPKRILAWHEMALDRLGGVELTIVYCTLCGTVIPYESVVDGEHVRFGTSGLLYRSNKLMFDHGTRSLWNTFEGVPVVGALVGSGRRLTHRPVVTTTWGEWRRMHPETTVLSRDTGYQRDYGEGVAYRAYFATDELMFEVPGRDDRLDNKDEVLVLRIEDARGEPRPLAIAADYLEDHRLHVEEHAGRRLLVVTSRDGANRVYDAGATAFERLAGDLAVVDADGGRWRVTEDALVHAADPERRAPRVAAQRAFWFGWRSQYPETRLVR